MAARIRKDDIVEVIAGEHRGARGKVLRVDAARDRVLIEGVNMVVRHVRRSQKHPQGGRIHKEAGIHMSNVQPLDPKTDKPARVRFKVERGGDGTVRKQRISVAGNVISDVSRGKRAAGSK